MEVENMFNKLQTFVCGYVRICIGYLLKKIASLLCMISNHSGTQNMFSQMSRYIIKRTASYCAVYLMFRFVVRSHNAVFIAIAWSWWVLYLDLHSYVLKHYHCYRYSFVIISLIFISVASLYPLTFRTLRMGSGFDVYIAISLAIVMLVISILYFKHNKYNEDIH